MTETTMTREDTGEFLPVRVNEQPDTEPPASQTPIFDSMADRPGAGDEWRRQAGLSRARFDGMGIADVDVQPSSVQWAELPAEPDPVDAALPADDEVVFYVDFNRRARNGLVKTVRHHGTEWVDVGQQVRAVDPDEHDMAYDAIVDTIEGDVVYLRVQWTAEAYMAADDPDPRPGRWVNVAEDDLLPARIVQVGDTNLPRRNDTFERRGWTPEPRPAITEPEDHGALDRWLERTEQRLRQWWMERRQP